VPLGDQQSGGREPVAFLSRVLERLYGPNNSVVAIVGDIDVAQMTRWADQYFAGIPADEPHRPVVTQEPPQRGERRIEVEHDANLSVMIGYHVPNARHPDAPALAMLASVLTGGRTARLTSRLVVRDRAATSIFASQQPGARYPRLFVFQATPIAPHTTVEIETAIYEELERLQRDPPTDFEMQRARNQIETSSVARVADGFGLAIQMAGSEALWNDWAQTFRDKSDLLKVTPAVSRDAAHPRSAPSQSIWAATLASSAAMGVMPHPSARLPWCVAGVTGSPPAP
jgi:predicted Zn-dependent peptidase